MTTKAERLTYQAVTLGELIQALVKLPVEQHKIEIYKKDHQSGQLPIQRLSQHSWHPVIKRIVDPYTRREKMVMILP